MPFVTAAFAIACIAAFVRLALLPQERAAMLLRHLAVVPSRLLALPPSPENFLTLLTASFLHASWMHIAGNMLYLLVFGPAAEGALGHLRFSAIYLAAGASGLLAQALAHPSSTTPIVGASASIAGLLGAYLVLLPKSKVTTVIPVPFALEFAALPAAFLVILWFVLQVAGALEAGSSGTAWFAHIAGFIVGAAMAAAFRRR